MEPDDAPVVIDVRIMPVGGRYEQRSAVFADAGLAADGAVWTIQAAASTVIGSAAWAATRGFAMARVRRCAATPRDVVVRVAQEYVRVQYDGAVDEPFEEEFSEDGAWRLAFKDTHAETVYSVRLMNPMLRRKRPPRVVGAARKAAMEPPAAD